jgi:hypothetical protein
MQAEVRPSAQNIDSDRADVAKMLGDVASAMRASPVDFDRLERLTELLASPPQLFELHPAQRHDCRQSCGRTG